MNRKQVKIALLGHGTVGQSVRRIILEQSDRLVQAIFDRTAIETELEIIGVLVSDPKKHPILGDDCYTVPAELFHQDYDILIELIGGVEPATGLMNRALADGKDVVTANKKALFTAQGSLEQAAKDHGVSLNYEASVGGAIPILRSVKSLSSGKTKQLQGIINGSTNYILTRVAQGLTLDQALQEASDRGCLEADPTSDIEAYDPMYKLGILTYLITGKYPNETEIDRVGITGLSAVEINRAQSAGQKYKLIAAADFETGQYSVKPEAIGPDHELFYVDGALNGISLKHEYAGDLTFKGAGAGGIETATAVIGDLIDAISLRVLR